MGFIVADPTSEGDTEEAVAIGAADAGANDLVDAIYNGTVNILIGDAGPDSVGYSEWYADGTGIILIDDTNDPLVLLAVALHEWFHGQNPPPPPPPGSTPEEIARWKACDEVGAHCAALAGLKAAADEGVYAPCALIDLMNRDAGNSQLHCAFGAGALRPPNPDPCGFSDLVDCLE